MATKGGPRIIDDLSSLKICLDNGNNKLQGDNRALKRGLNRSVTVDDSDVHLDILDATNSNNTERFTITVWVEVNSYNTGYAWHPINKWNSGYTNSATIVLYAFQDYRSGGGGTPGDGNGNDDHNRYGFYYHSSGSAGWTGYSIHENNSITGGHAERMNFPRKNFFAFAYDVNENSSKPKIYCNGEFMGSATAAPNGIGNYQYTQGDLRVNTSFSINSNTDNGVTYLQIYDKMLTENEITRIYNHTKRHHGY